MATNLPANHLDQALVASLKAELNAALPLKRAAAIAALPTPSKIREALETAIRSFGSPLKREECDACLGDLALVVPRAGLDDDKIDRMLDLYFGLLRQAGVTKPMLMRAQQAYVMAPKKGKPRFFPDPGELFELCADEAHARRKSIAALLRAIDIIDGKHAQKSAVAGEVVVDISERLKDLATKMSTNRPSTLHREEAKPVTPAHAKTARAETNPAELMAALERRTNGAA